MRYPPGTRLGPYQLGDRLGAGGMGEVYRAFDPRLGRDVAVKVLAAAFACDPDWLRRFEREARAAGRLNHPNLIAVHDVGTHQGSPYLVTELLEGETLRARLRRGRLPWRQAAEIGRAVAEGVAAAHDLGIVHRDLKPENVFLTGDGRVKLLDFGLAKRSAPADGEPGTAPAATDRAAVTEPGLLLGTRGYMSPEQVRGEPVGPLSDLFALGALLHEMLAGVPAFRRPSPAETAAAILKEEPEGLADAGVPPTLERVVRRCLEKDGRLRVQSARDLALALEVALAGAARPAPRPVRAGRFLGALAMVVLLAAALLVVSAARTRAGSDRSLALPPAAPGMTPPRFERLTFRRGNVLRARLGPDGRTVVYSAAWDGRPAEIFSTRSGSPGSRPLGFPAADVVAVSPATELALLLKETQLTRHGPGTLARVAFEGGTPREIAADARSADWTAEGRDLAVLRTVGGEDRIEWPAGRLFYRSPSRLVGDIRISPGGERVAFFERRPAGVALVVAGRGREHRALSAGWVYVQGLAWSPSGDELWFAATRSRSDNALRAVDLAGRERVVWPTPGWFALHDIGPAGEVLLEQGSQRYGVVLRPAGANLDERDLSWLDGSRLAAVSPEGGRALWNEVLDGGGASGAFYLRDASGSPPVRLGEGMAECFTADGAHVLAHPLDDRFRLLVVPTGAGEVSDIRSGEIAYGRVACLPGDRIVFRGTGPDGASRLYLQDLPDGVLTAVSPPGFADPFAPSPGGDAVAAVGPDRKAAIVPLAGGEPRPVPGAEAGEDPLCWRADGALLVGRWGEVPMRIVRIDLASGRRSPWKDLLPPDPIGIVAVGDVAFSPDGSAYAYSYQRVTLSDLYLASGLR